MASLELAAKGCGDGALALQISKAGVTAKRSSEEGRSTDPHEMALKVLESLLFFRSIFPSCFKSGPGNIGLFQNETLSNL